MINRLYGLILLFFALTSCTEVQIKDESNEQKIKTSSELETVKNTNAISEYDKLNDFTKFLANFNSDCNFQKLSVHFPLEVISLIEFETNDYDTSFLKINEYECMELTEPKSNIMEGRVKLKLNNKGEKNVIITFGVEDTGIHIQYFFKIVDDEWTLYKIVDESL